MNELRKAAKQALEALDTNYYAVADASPHKDVMAYSDAIAALKAALEQPEPIIESEITPDKDGPVAVLLEYENGERELRFKNNGWPAKETPLYTQPQRREWHSLTDDEIKATWEASRAALPRFLCFARAIEAALKERNQ